MGKSFQVEEPEYANVKWYDRIIHSVGSVWLECECLQRDRT